MSFLDEISGFGDLIGEAQRGASRDIHVALPCVVTEAYDPVRNSVTVKPLLDRAIPAADGGYQAEELPEIYDVPVAWPMFGGAWTKFQMTFPIAVGDELLCVFPDYDIQAWRTSGQRSEPGDCRSHHLAGAVALPCALRTLSQPMTSFNATAMEFGHEAGLRVAVTQTQMQVGGVTDAAALASKVDALATAVADVRAFVIAHTHGGVTTGSGASAVPTGPFPGGYSGGSSASAHLKVGG